MVCLVGWTSPVSIAGDCFAMDTRILPKGRGPRRCWPRRPRRVCPAKDGLVATCGVALQLQLETTGLLVDCRTELTHENF